MYLYIYDNFLQSKKYEKIVSQIEGKITDLGITGKISRLSPLISPGSVINQELRYGISTVVAVGSDDLFSKVITSPLKNHKNSLIYGFIPIQRDSMYAKIMGLPVGQNACDVISARILKKVDLGKINSHFFFSYVKFNTANEIVCDDQYAISPISDINEAIIKNFYSNARTTDPQDGKLEIEIKNSVSKKSLFKKNVATSLFYCKKIKIRSGRAKNFTINLDGIMNINPPVIVSILKKKINLITGKKRLFDI